MAAGSNADEGREGAQLARLVARHTTDAILITSAEQIDEPGPRIVFVNEAFTRMTGYTAEEVIGRTPRLLQGPKTQRSELDRLRRATESCQPAHAELINYRKDGSEFWVEIDISPVMDETGRCTHWIATQRETTARREAEEERLGLLHKLEDERAALQSIIDAMPFGVLVAEAESGRLIAGNRRVEEILRHPLLPTEAGAGLLAWDGDMGRGGPLERAFAGEVVHDVEIQYQRGDGTRTWLSASAAPIHDREGKIVRAVVVFNDISARKQDEDHLKELAARLETALESTTDCVVVADTDWTITYINRRAQQLLGAEGEPAGSDLRELFPDFAAKPFLEAFERALSEQHPMTIDDFCPQLNRWLEIHAYPSPRSLTLFFRDVTRERTLEEQLLQSQKMEAIGQLAGGIAHDFNNLLTVINGYAQLLCEQMPATAPHRRELENIRAAGERAAQLTQQLLAFGRKQVLQPKTLNLNEVVSTVKRMLVRVLPENIELTTRLDPALAPVKADPAQIEQVIINLAINARDAMPQGGQLQIETSNVELDEEYASAHLDLAPGRYVLLSVSDTGTGMTPEVLSRIFEPFFTTKPKGQGTGLGLPTVFGIVKQSGGHLAVTSEPGRGSTFKVYLLETEQPARAPEPEEKKSAAPLNCTETILLVEDDENVRNFTAVVLRQFGYTVITAANGHDALLLASGYPQPIHLLLTDVIMPKMSGRELANELLRQRPETKVLFISGYAEDAIVHDGELDPGIDFLQKPYALSDLAARIRAVLDAPRRKRGVLVVDDDDGVRDYLRLVLENAGYDVTLARDGREVLKLCHQVPVDLVLTDLVMPEQEGIITIQLLKREFTHLKIIAMSGAVSTATLSAAKHLGANEVLQKPISPQRLVRMVKEMIG